MLPHSLEAKGAANQNGVLRCSGLFHTFGFRSSGEILFPKKPGPAGGLQLYSVSAHLVGGRACYCFSTVGSGRPAEQIS
jgi:hypothetical protein